MAQISIVIPALNEAESIGRVVREMPWDRIAECVVVDNGSTDGTAEIARRAGARVIESPRGYGAACDAGAKAAVRTSDVLVFMDGDGADDVTEMPRLVGPIRRGEADFVIGSRIRGEREPGSMLGSQVFAAKSSASSTPPTQRKYRFRGICLLRAPTSGNLDLSPRVHIGRHCPALSLSHDIRRYLTGV